MTLRNACLIAVIVGLSSNSLPIAQTPNTAILLDPANPEMKQQAPAAFNVLLDTSKGPIRIEIQREWSPHGVDRFYNLVRHGYYDGAKVFRIRAGFWVQFGIAADPRIATVWRSQNIPDDPRRLSNVRGTVAYAFRDPNGRTTQVFINLRDNSATHDGEPFVPFGRVTSGMEVADAWYAEYGEKAGGGIRGGRQDKLFEEGNAYLDREFPLLDFIKRATIPVEFLRHFPRLNLPIRFVDWRPGTRPVYTGITKQPRSEAKRGAGGGPCLVTSGRCSSCS